ncbi:MAG: aryl-sulfate sulfotransferase [Dehalococcoidia bacterium]|nr:aryl-sulfate sulfotransferase [Dehalococcoidia bacterium]
MGWSPFRPTGLTHHAPGLSFKGYTLIAPIGQDFTLLLDMDGRIVHRWRTPGFRPFCPRLMPDGRLLVLSNEAGVERPKEPGPRDQPPSAPAIYRLIGGAATDVLELDWDGTITWRYSNLAIHHDFAVLKNGNVVLPEFQEVPEDLAKRVRGGVRKPGEKLPPLISDDFIEVDRAGAVVDRIHLWELLDPVKDPIGPLERRWEWTHTNAVDITPDQRILFSCRDNSRIGIINRETKRLDWKFGAPETFYQHHVTWLHNGNVLVFDNGMNRSQDLPHSRVVEINPKDNSIAWKYQGNPPPQFFSAHISGCHRLSNGNTLICEGASGRLFEVTPAGEYAWEWVNPIHFARGETRMNWVFRAYRYGPDYSGLAGRDLDPTRYADLNRLFGL